MKSGTDFIEVVTRVMDGYVYEWIDNDMMYRKVKVDESNPARVIKCNCGEPATHLDVFFAWESSDCWCDKCYNEKEKK